MSREYAEKDLTFLGLLVIQNKVKPDSPAVLRKLNTCGIRTLMASGDNLLTSISVARQCNIITDTANVYLGEVETNEDGED